MKGIMVDVEGNIIVRNNTMVIDDVDAQIAEHVICAFKGEYSEKPNLGGELIKYQNGTPGPFWSGEVRAQLLDEGVNASVDILPTGDFVVNVKKRG